MNNYPRIVGHVCDYSYVTKHTCRNISSVLRIFERRYCNRGNLLELSCSRLKFSHFLTKVAIVKSVKLLFFLRGFLVSTQSREDINKSFCVL